MSPNKGGERRVIQVLIGLWSVQGIKSGMMEMELERVPVWETAVWSIMLEVTDVGLVEFSQVQ